MTMWILQIKGRNGTWRRIPNSDAWETGEDAAIELRRYIEDSDRPRSDFRVVQSLRDNPEGSSGLVTGLLVLAAVGISYLLFKEKPKPDVVPAPAPPPPAPAPTPTPLPPVPPLPPIVIVPACVVTKEKFEAWALSKGKIGVWWPYVVNVTPPNATVVKASVVDPLFTQLQTVQPQNITVATNNGEQIWYFQTDGEPYTSPKIRQQVCIWIAQNL